MGGDIRYWAFLSYSHADRRDAGRLHRALESYRIPRRLVGRQGPLGIVPTRLHPVFRDRDELTASGHIGAVVEAAIAASRAMIVLCSPASAASPWVEAEIVAFNRLQPDAPVLCVLLDGEPMASRDTDASARECLPPSLRTRFDSGVGIADAAPVAVDLRAQGDGWRLGVQKLVAGLAGVPLDQLVQRDAHRRHQRLALLSAVLAAIAIALGTMAVLALRARDEARAERAQAESLIEFMLVDLRKKLEPVGRLDVLDAVGARALKYYDEQDPRKLDANALGRRARSQQLIGEIDVRRGGMDSALTAFRHARDTTAELLDRAPADPQRIFEHAQSVFWVGYYDWQHGDLGAAEQAMLEYQRLAKRLVAIDPANMDWQAELSYSHSNLGVMLLDQGRPREAMTQFEMSRRANERRVASKPGDATPQVDLGQDYSWLSSAEALELRFDEAARLRQREIALYRSMLQREPGNAVVLERMMYARRFLAGLLLARGELDAAASEIAEANRMADAQLRLEPDNADWLQAAAKSRLMQAGLLGWRSQPQQGLVELERVRPLVAGLLARDAEVWAWRVELQEAQAQVASDLLRQEGRREAALEIARASVQRLQAVMQDPWQRAKSERWLLLSLGRVARLLSELGDAQAARAAWQALDQVGSRHPSLDAEGMLWLARAREAQGAIEASARLRQQLREAGYRHPDFYGASAADTPPSRKENMP
ncbi:MAG: toll/interleukin-1 receptor domain-containing protein [Luteimonas sp.]